MPWTYIISDLNGAEIDGTFYDKELQKTNQKECRIEKVNKTIEKAIDYMLNGKDTIICLVS